MAESESTQSSISRPVLVTILVASLGSAFAVGVLFDHATSRKATAGRASQTALAGPGHPSGTSERSATGARPVFGSITAVSGDIITVNSQHDNSSKSVHINSQTQIVGSGKAATIADLTTGSTVMVSGPETNGVVEATSIMVNPTFGPGSAHTAPATTPDPNQY